jgi:integrase/recombinase XerD
MGRPKHTGGASRPLEPREVKRLLAVVSNSSRNRERNTMLIKTLLYTAGRISEVLFLKVSDVWDGHQVYPSLVFRKTKNKHTRRIPINSNFASDLEAYLKNSNLKLTDPLIPSTRSSSGNNHINPTAGSLLVKRLMVSAGIMDCSAHSTRKFALCHMLRNNVNIRTLQAISGHRSINSLEHYLYSSSSEISDAIETINF